MIDNCCSEKVSSQNFSYAIQQFFSSLLLSCFCTNIISQFAAKIKKARGPVFLLLLLLTLKVKFAARPAYAQKHMGRPFSQDDLWLLRPLFFLLF